MNMGKKKCMISLPPDFEEEMTNSNFLVVLGLLFFILMLVAGPVLTIYSLNILFGLSIPITIKTFFATMWLCMVIGARASASFKRS
jgi:hypothetical protein